MPGTSVGTQIAASAVKPATFDPTGYAALTFTKIGEVINNNVYDDFWQAYDSARHDVIETLTTTLRQEKGD